MHHFTDSDRASAAGLSASVVISTKNRKEELRAALLSVAEQSVPVELIVIDDGSSDGTTEMARREFPQCIVYRFERSEGYVVRRNEGARLAKGDIVFSLDDDAILSTNRIVEQTLQEFSLPQIGAIGMPYSDVNRDNVVRQKAPDANRIWVTDRYIGTAHAVRRELFLALGGYREHLIHQGEEGDFCLRMLNAGYVVRLGNADPIHHLESPRRDFRRMDYFGRRNDVLFAWHNVPMPYLPAHVLVTSLNGARFAFHNWRIWHMLRGTVAGYANILRYWRRRCPVRAATYHLSRKIKRKGPLPLEEIGAQICVSGGLGPLAAIPDEAKDGSR